MSASRLSVLAAILAAAPLHADTPAGVDEKMAPVKGTITLDGKPLSGARVIFHLGDDQFVGAKTRADGTFRVKWVPVGTHKVTVELRVRGWSVLPPRYAEEDKAALRVEVKEGANTIDLALKSR